MNTIIAGIVGAIAREVIQFTWGLVSKWFKQYQTNKKSDEAIDQHAKDSAQEMENTHDPDKMDQADSDILSGH